MRRTLTANAVALGLCTIGTANALTMNITQMNFNGLFNATGTLNSAGTGHVTGLDDFFGSQWTVDGISFFSGTGPHTWQTIGDNDINDSIPIGTATYNFSLTTNQVAWGVFFDWSGNYDIPILNIMTCTNFSTGSVCQGTGTPMQTPPFAGQAPSFNGTVANSSAIVPVPAAAWLMGSGLVGLASVTRRRKNTA